MIKKSLFFFFIFYLLFFGQNVLAATNSNESCKANLGTCNTHIDTCGANEYKIGTCNDTNTACCKEKPPQQPANTSASFSYTPLEEIPGQGKPNDFPSYVKAIYAFAVFTVGIAALVMVVFGGFIYITAAGNTSRVDKGKEFIRDALLGIVIAFGSYLILYVVNPDLVNIDLRSLENLRMRGGDGSSAPFPQHPIYPTGNGSCTPVQSGDCSVDSLKSTCFGSNAEAWSRLCNKESGGTPIKSQTDVCDNYGRASFSGGLFQINVFSHGDKLGDARCVNLGSKGTCAPGKRRSDGVCLGWNCRLNSGKTVDDLNYCMSLTMNPNTNITIACRVSRNGATMQPWSISARKCGLTGR